MSLEMCVRNEPFIKFSYSDPMRLTVKSIGIVPRSIKKIVLLLVFIPFTLRAENIPVKESLANLIESAVVKTNFDINISRQTSSSLEIDKINGIGVCEPAAKDHVIRLQKTLIRNVSAKQVFSMYGAYIRSSTDGKVLYLDGSSPKFRKIIKGCINLYVRVK